MTTGYDSFLDPAHALDDAADGASRPAKRRPAPGKVTLTGQLPARRPPAQRKQAADAGPPAAVAQASGGGQPLPDDTRAQMERSLGADFSTVRVHEGPQAEALGAVAFTQGTDIHFAPGAYAPGSPGGQEVLGHELAHVVQQSEGRVQATGQAAGVDLNDDASLEREADDLGARAARGEPAAAAGTGPGPAAPVVAGPTQRKALATSRGKPAVAGVIQRLRRKTDNSEVDIGALPLVRVYDILRRPSPDPDVEGFVFENGDRAKLQQRAEQLLPGAFARLRQLQTSTEDQQVTTARNVQVSGGDQQDLIDFIRLMAEQGEIRGLDEWMGYVSSYGGNSTDHAENRQDHINELWEAARRLLMEGAHKVDLSESEISGSNQTADLSFGGTQVEIKTVRQPIHSHKDLMGQIAAGIGKFNGADEGSYEVTIFASLDATLLSGGDAKTRGKGNKAVETRLTADPDTPSITTTVSNVQSGQVLNTRVQSLVDELVDDLNRAVAKGNKTHYPGIDRVRRVVVFMENAVSYHATCKSGVWTGALL